MKAAAFALLTLLAGCVDEPFTFTLEVSGITDETVTADGVVQTPVDGRVILTRRFDSYQQTREHLPTPIDIMVERNGQTILMESIPPGLCGGEPLAWQTKKATIVVGDASSDVSCRCEQGESSVEGTCT
jgi:hypothetical protein